jgi:hypothetical protein
METQIKTQQKVTIEKTVTLPSYKKQGFNIYKIDTQEEGKVYWYAKKDEPVVFRITTYGTSIASIEETVVENFINPALEDATEQEWKDALQNLANQIQKELKK